MNVESLRDYGSQSHAAPMCGINLPPEVRGGPGRNLPALPVQIPPGFKNLRVSSVLDPHGARLAAGIASAVEWSRASELGYDPAVIALGYVRGFACARSIGPDRTVREVEPIWRDVFPRCVAAFRGESRYEALGAALAEMQGDGRSPRLDAVAGILGALIAMAELRPSEQGAPQSSTPRIPFAGRDPGGERLRAGVAFVRAEAVRAGRERSVPDLQLLAQRGADAYAASFACFVRLARFGRATPHYAESSGDTIRRGVAAGLDMALATREGWSPADHAYALGDYAVGCVVADAGGVESALAQAFAVCAIVQEIQRQSTREDVGK